MKIPDELRERCPVTALPPVHMDANGQPVTTSPALSVFGLSADASRQVCQAKVDMSVAVMENHNAYAAALTAQLTHKKKWWWPFDK